MDMAQVRWRRLNGAHLLSLVRRMVVGWGVVRKRRSVRLRVAQLACLLCQVASASGAFTLAAGSWPSRGGAQVPDWQVKPPFHSAYQRPNRFRGPAHELEQAPTDDGETG